MRWPYIISLIALLGATLLLFFNILCGASTHSVLGKWYWFEAQTDSIPGANSVTRWTNYNSCGVSNGRNVDCSEKHAAYPISPVSNFGTTEGVPQRLHKKHGVTYFLSKVGWAFLLLGLLFTLLALLPVAVSFCLPSLTVLNVGTNFATNTALVFTVLSAALLTAGVVKARNAFKKDDKSTHLGKTMLGFIWASVFLLFLSSVLSGVGCLGNFIGKKKERKRYSENYDSSSHETYGNNYVNEKDNRGGFFSRKKKQENTDLEEVGYAAGLGASGATSNVPRELSTNQKSNSGKAALGTATAGAVGAGVFGSGSKTSDYHNDRGLDENTTSTTKKSDLDDVGYAAGVGASGATSDLAHGSHTHGNTSESTNPINLEEVGYAAGLGASGATSKLTKDGGLSSSKNKDKSVAGIGKASVPTQETNYQESKGLNDVAYAAGLGASGATSKYTNDAVLGSSKTKDSKSGNQLKPVVGTGLSSGTSKKSTQTDKTQQSKGLNDVGYAAGLGASGATSKYPKEGTTQSTSNKDQKSEPAKAGALAKIAYAAGIGASGATSKYVQDGSIGSNTHQGKDTESSNTKGLKDVGYAAGLGSSGATSGYTKDDGSNLKSSQTDGSKLGKKNDLNDVAYAAGYGASGASSNRTDAHHKSGDSKVGSTKYSEQKSVQEQLDDVAYKAGYGASGATSGITKDDVKHTGSGSSKEESSDSNKGILSAAAAILGLGGASAASKDQSTTGNDQQKDSTYSDTTADRTAFVEQPTQKFSSEGADTGHGSTNAGANAEKLKQEAYDYENKSTVLPVGGNNKHLNQDPYGNKTLGYETGVPDNAAKEAAALAISSKPENTYTPVKTGPASSVEDTYKNSAPTKKPDLTNTQGYEPTAYYQKKTHDDIHHDTKDEPHRGDVVGAAGVPVVGYGATKENKRYSTSSSVYDDNSDLDTKKTSTTSNQQEKKVEGLVASAYAAGFASTGATSNLSGNKNKSSTQSGTSGATYNSGNTSSGGQQSKNTQSDSYKTGTSSATNSNSGKTLGGVQQTKNSQSDSHKTGIPSAIGSGAIGTSQAKDSSTIQSSTQQSGSQVNPTVSTSHATEDPDYIPGSFGTKSNNVETTHGKTGLNSNYQSLDPESNTDPSFFVKYATSVEEDTGALENQQKSLVETIVEKSKSIL